jgi:hypothetical protein
VNGLLKVECYAGYKADEQPRRFSFIRPPEAKVALSPRRDAPAERVYEVSEVLDRWHGPGYECFKVRADDRNLYVLRHKVGDDTWSLDAYRRDTAPANP